MNLPSLKWIFVAVLCVVFFMVFVSSNPKRKSPKAIVKLYYKARNSGNTDLLKQILYFEPETTDEQKQARIKTLLACPDEKWMMCLFGIVTKAKYEKYLDETTAEVGVVSTSLFRLGKQIPVDQVILKKDDGIWKYHYSMRELKIDELVKRLRENPEDADLYFHLAIEYISENLAKSHRYYLRYYELDPDGFWVDEDFGKLIKEYRKEYEQTEIYEKEMLAKIDALPAKHILSKAIEYQRLCQLFMEKKDYHKASSYFALAEETLKKDNSEYNYWKDNLNKVKMELQLRKSGQYHDILDEIEAKQNK